jgi:hypothetical protein
MNNQQQNFYPQVQTFLSEQQVQQQQQQQFLQQQYLQQQYLQQVQQQQQQQQQPETTFQPQFIQPEPLRPLKFETSVTRPKENIGQVDQVTGKLTFTSSNWFFKIMIIIGSIYLFFFTMFILFVGFSSNNYPLYLFVIPFVFLIIALLDRKYQVIFDDANHLIHVTGGFRFLTCVSLFSFNKTIRYNEVKDIYNELFYMNKSKIVLITESDEHVALLGPQRMNHTTSFHVHYSQRIVEEMREHLVFVTNQ